MKLTYKGTGTVHIPGVGDISSGETKEVPEEIAAARVKQDPRTWGKPKKEGSAPRGRE